MAYDPATGTMVLFGGVNSVGILDDTWTWNGTTWSQASPAASPSARDGASMDYDPATATMVLFGGSTTSALNETWAWNGNTWSQVSPLASPPGRAGASMDYDPATATMVLFGGTANGFSPLGDTWTYAQVATEPDAPTIGTATGGNGEATVSFAAPASDGGSAITSFTVTATDMTTPAHGGQTASGTASPITVTGLTNGDNYTFTVTATNSVGTGPASAASNPVTPAGNSPQTISFTSTAPGRATVNGPTYTPTATATSGLPVAITVDATSSSVCSIAAGVVAFTGSGLCTLDANQPGDANWSAAPQVSQSFSVVGAGIAAGNHLAALPDGTGYWVVNPGGSVSAFGAAVNYGSLAGQHLNGPIVGIASTADGKGYWLVATDGGIFSFGDANFFGSEGGKPLNQPVVGMAADPSGGGYWLVATDGGVFTFGDAPFYGSMGGQPLNQPVEGMTATPNGHGYWLVATDGGVFTFGDAGFFGSVASSMPIHPVVGLFPTGGGNGYTEVDVDGTPSHFGAAG